MRAQKDQVIDHINLDGLDNRLENLRFATHSQNMGNSPVRNNIGLKGVFKANKSTWTAGIQKDGKTYRSRSHKTPEDAARAYDQMALVLFGEFALLNFPEDADAMLTARKAKP